MPAETAIEWTESTWNPVTGCTEVTPGCAHCYAKTFAERWRGVKGHPYEQGFDLRLWPSRLDYPLKWKRPRMIFVNSMSDLFHEDIPFEYVERIFAVMREANHHTFQVLTKRHERMSELAPHLDWPENVWMGVTIENKRWALRADHLREVPAAVRFVSAEPSSPSRSCPMDPSATRSVPSGGCRILLQTVGWRKGEVRRSRVRRPGMERDATRHPDGERLRDRIKS
jgi:protein gp37